MNYPPPPGSPGYGPPPGAPPAYGAPPQYGAPPGAPPPMGGGDPSGQVGGPGIGLAVVGGLSVLVNLLWAVLNLLGSGLSVAGGGDAMAGVMGGVVGSVLYGFFAILGGVVLFGGLKMKNLQSYGLAMAAAIMAMLPCTVGYCCLLGLPLGIWALIVLMKPEVKAAFR